MRGFSLKVPVKPVVKSGAGACGFVAAMTRRTEQIDKAEIPDMVTIQVNNLIDFVAEVFAHSDSSPEEARRIATYLTTANLTGHDSHGVIRVPVYVQLEENGLGGSRPDRRDRGRYALARGDRRQVRLWTDGDAAGGARSASRNARRRALPRSRCAMPAISAASATGRRWPPPKAWCRCISSTPPARCW